MSDTATFCPKCGGKNETAIQSQMVTPIAPSAEAVVANKMEKNKLVGIIAVGAVVLIALIVLFIFLFGGSGKGSYEDVIKAYVKGSQELSAEQIVNLLPPDMVEAGIEEGIDGKGFEDKEEFVEAMQEMLDEMWESAGLQTDYKFEITYKIIDAEKYTRSELKEEKESIENELGVEIDFNEIRKVEVLLNIKTEDMTSENTVYLKVGKIGNRWYMTSPA